MFYWSDTTRAISFFIVYEAPENESLFSVSFLPILLMRIFPVCSSYFT